jgi:hypothetical protein
MWALATRSRPANCARFIAAWIETKSSTPVYVRLDLDDPELETIKNLPWPVEFKIHIGSRIGLSRSINEMFTQYPDEPWYGFLADDLLPKTEYWDLELVQRAGATDISYPNDCGPLLDQPTHPCVGGDLVRAIGWFGFPPCHHFFTDTVWKYLGNQLNNIYKLDNVIVEHLHYSMDKSEKDQTYIESSERWKTDKRGYRDWVDQEGDLLVSRLKRDIYNSK